MHRRLDILGRADDEEGFTLIEVLIAALVLSVAALATFGVLSAATRNAQRAQATQVALDKAQEEMEKLHAIPYAELALERLPDHSDNPMNPNYRVSGATFLVNRDSTTEDPSLMVRKGDFLYGTHQEIEKGPVLPGPISFQEGNVSGQIFRYIVWRDDPSCPQSENLAEDFCPGGQDFKQLIVAVKLNKPVPQAAETNYVEVQSQVANPEAQAQRSTQGPEPGPGGGDPPTGPDDTDDLSTGKAVTAQQFFLSDTPCSASGVTTRQPISGDHPLHNTLGVCANGPQIEETKGAPDALLRAAPPDSAPEDESDPALFDYSSDAYLDPLEAPNTDHGLQLYGDDSPECHKPPQSLVHPEAKLHVWVTDPMPAIFKLSGTATLEFYSRTIDERPYAARLCVYLFVRHEAAGAPAPEDPLFMNPLTGLRYWTEEIGSWPRTSWDKLRLTMQIAPAPFEIQPGDRLGIALSLDSGASGKEPIQIMYDHPNYPTRLEVDTTTPFEGG